MNHSCPNETNPLPVDLKIPAYVRFLSTALAGVGACMVTHPMDLVKYRLQLSGKGGAEKSHKSLFHAFYNVFKYEGPFAIYKGLTASLYRQFTLSTIRFSLLTVIIDQYTKEMGEKPSLDVQIAIALITGFLGGFIGNPSDLALVRMAADGRLPPEERYNYKNVFDAFSRIKKEEGYLALWIGWKPGILRSMIMNVTQFVLYKNTKLLLLKTGYFNDDFTLYLICSLWTGIISALATAPVDIAKTRIMTMKWTDDTPEYSGIVDSWVKIVKKEGFDSLWKGVVPYFMRTTPHNVIVFLILEFLTKMYKRYILGDTSGSGF